MAASLFVTNIASAATPPDSGSAIDQVNQSQAPPQVKKPDEVQVQTPSPPTPNGNNTKIHVNGFRITGETPRPEKELLDLIKDKTNQDLILGDLYNIADRITQYLRQKGYLVAFAYIPAQSIADGVVNIAVVPGKFGAAHFNNKARIRTERLEQMVSSLKPGSIITQSSLERVLLLLNDLSGIRIKATLAPGEAPGTADLILNVEDAAKITGAVNGDNGGNASTGRVIGGIQVTVNNMSHTGDELSFAGMASGQGLKDGDLVYSMPVGHDGLRMTLNYSYVNYKLGNDFADLDASGWAHVLTWNWRYPFIRSRNASLYGTIGLESKGLTDRIGVADLDSTRSESLLTLGMNADVFDRWLGGGYSTYSLVGSYGKVKINNADAARTDAETAQTAGYFEKLNLGYTRLQYLAKDLTLNIRFKGQLAESNLDSAEKFFLGGADGVRAYDQGTGSGDTGELLSTELRWRVASSQSGMNDLYLTTFIDAGHVQVNKEPWPGCGDNTETLRSLGIGFIWTYQKFSFQCDYAEGIGDNPYKNDDSHVWARFVAYF
ncbi:MAG TPA: ShlB/FhaC/HecB family hemolysin secretion/activation protein [Bacillota bacterium]|nr:ShlB/FhaC/HecB family hemolysin secretion/activation protein [Bacillota bacterium]